MKTLNKFKLLILTGSVFFTHGLLANQRTQLEFQCDQIIQNGSTNLEKGKLSMTVLSDNGKVTGVEGAKYEIFENPFNIDPVPGGIPLTLSKVSLDEVSGKSEEPLIELSQTGKDVEDIYMNITLLNDGKKAIAFPDVQKRLLLNGEVNQHTNGLNEISRVIYSLSEKNEIANEKIIMNCIIKSKSIRD